MVAAASPACCGSRQPVPVVRDAQACPDQTETCSLPLCQVCCVVEQRWPKLLLAIHCPSFSLPLQSMTDSDEELGLTIAAPTRGAKPVPRFNLLSANYHAIKQEVATQAPSRHCQMQPVPQHPLPIPSFVTQPQFRFNLLPAKNVRAVKTEPATQKPAGQQHRSPAVHGSTPEPQPQHQPLAGLCSVQARVQPRTTSALRPASAGATPREPRVSAAHHTSHIMHLAAQILHNASQNTHATAQRANACSPPCAPLLRTITQHRSHLTARILKHSAQPHAHRRSQLHHSMLAVMCTPEHCSLSEHLTAHCALPVHSPIS